MRVRAKVFAYGASFMLVASVQPVIGGRVTPPMPHVSKPADSISGPCLIPYGAREFRIEPGYAPGSWTQFRHPLNFVNPAIRPVNFVNAECFDWRPIPARSNTVVGDEMLCASIIYR
jgi:hypothetical protein